MDAIDLHALANQPGAGKAADQLKAAGHWDEYAGAGELRDWNAWLSTFVLARAELTIKARCEAEARQIILDLAREDRIGWIVSLDPDDEEPDDRLIETLIDSGRGAE